MEVAVTQLASFSCQRRIVMLQQFQDGIRRIIAPFHHEWCEVLVDPSLVIQAFIAAYDATIDLVQALIPQEQIKTLSDTITNVGILQSSVQRRQIQTAIDQVHLRPNRPFFPLPFPFLAPPFGWLFGGASLASPSPWPPGVSLVGHAGVHVGVGLACLNGPLWIFHSSLTSDCAAFSSGLNTADWLSSRTNSSCEACDQPCWLWASSKAFNRWTSTSRALNESLWQSMSITVATVLSSLKFRTPTVAGGFWTRKTPARYPIATAGSFSSLSTAVPLPCARCTSSCIRKRLREARFPGLFWCKRRRRSMPLGRAAEWKSDPVLEVDEGLRPRARSLLELPLFFFFFFLCLDPSSRAERRGSGGTFLSSSARNPSRPRSWASPRAALRPRSSRPGEGDLLWGFRSLRSFFSRRRSSAGVPPLSLAGRLLASCPAPKALAKPSTPSSPVCTSPRATSRGGAAPGAGWPPLPGASLPPMIAGCAFSQAFWSSLSQLRRSTWVPLTSR